MYRAARRVQPAGPTDRRRLSSREPRPPTRRPSPRPTSHVQGGSSHEPPRLRHRERAGRQPNGHSPISTTPPSASSRWTSTRPPTSRATSRAPSAGTGPASCPTASAATSPAARTSASCCPTRASARTPHRALRRQQQLVRGVGLLAAQAVRPPRRAHPQRRSQVLAGQRAAVDRRRADARADRLPAARAGLQPARLPRRHPAAARRSRPRAGRRPLARPSTTARSSRRPA